MADEDCKYDEMLEQILKEKNSISDFLDVIFGFLARNTDFYYVMDYYSDPCGFPRGMKEQIVMNSFRKFDLVYQMKKIESSEPVPLPLNEVEIEANEIELDDSGVLSPPSPKRRNINEFNAENEDGNTIKSEEPKSPEFFQSSEYYNGAKFDTYCWSQTINDLEIHVRLPEHIKTGKQLVVTISSDFIKIVEKGSNNIILEGKLYSKCKYKDVVWSISNGKLQITLDKCLEIWWKRFLENENEVDLTKIDCSRDITELPGEMQAVIEKARWDQEQKLLGRPTSNDIRNTELLRKAWDAEGSPFKGQPFDSSIVKFSN